jgi:hypothetical protein
VKVGKGTVDRNDGTQWMMPHIQNIVLLLMLSAQAVAGNVRADNFHARHLLHDEHARLYDTLTAAPHEEIVWRYNDAGAPLANKDSYEKARLMEMEDDEAADQVRASIASFRPHPVSWRSGGMRCVHPLLTALWRHFLHSLRPVPRLRCNSALAPPLLRLALAGCKGC